MDTFNYPEQDKKEGALETQRLKMHSKELGLEVPENYFEISKQEILNKIGTEKEPKTKLISLQNKKVLFSIAASIALLFTITIFQMKEGLFKSQEKKVRKIALLEENNDLINSLFVEDSDDFVEDYLNTKVLEDL